MYGIVEYPGHTLHKKRVRVVEQNWTPEPIGDLKFGPSTIVETENGACIVLLPEQVRIIGAENDAAPAA